MKKLSDLTKDEKLKLTNDIQKFYSHQKHYVFDEVKEYLIFNGYTDSTEYTYLDFTWEMFTS